MTCATDRARPPAEVQSEGGEGITAPSTEAAGDEAISSSSSRALPVAILQSSLVHL